MPLRSSLASTQKRLESLDAYRGMIMATLLCGSIFGSLKGHQTWNWLSSRNEHVAWEGCTYWDLIQPSFMYMVGVAMPFALARRTRPEIPGASSSGTCSRGWADPHWRLA